MRKRSLSILLFGIVLFFNENIVYSSDASLGNNSFEKIKIEKKKADFDSDQNYQNFIQNFLIEMQKWEKKEGERKLKELEINHEGLSKLVALENIL